MTRTLFACLALATASVASAQWSYNFESLSPGDILGQDSWVAVTAGSTPPAGGATIQSVKVSPLDASTKALMFQRVIGQAGGADMRAQRVLGAPVTSGSVRVQWDLMMSGRSNPTASNLFLSGLLYSGVGVAAINQIIQPYGQNGGGPGGALNGFGDIDGLDISGYVGYNLVSGYLYPDTWYRFEFDMDWSDHSITNIRTTDINGGTLGLPTEMGTYLPLFGHPRLKWYFNNDGTNWTDQWNRIGFRASGMQGDAGTEYLCIDNFAITPVNRIHATIDLQDFAGGNIAGQKVFVEVRDGSGNILDRMAIAPDASGNVYFHTKETGVKTIALKGSHWLRDVKTGVDLSTGEAGLFSNMNGDCDGDNEVGIGDYALISGAYGAYGGDVGLANPDAGWAFEADLNGDNIVDIGDYAILSANYGLLGDD